jgi:hypothetical protein
VFASANMRHATTLAESILSPAAREVFRKDGFGAI